MINIFFLMAVAFVPFPTVLVAEHLRQSDLQDAALAYGFTLTVTASVYSVLWFYAMAGNDLLRDDADPQVVSGITRSFLPGPWIYLTPPWWPSGSRRSASSSTRPSPPSTCSRAPCSAGARRPPRSRSDGEHRCSAGDRAVGNGRPARGPGSAPPPSRVSPSSWCWSSSSPVRDAEFPTVKNCPSASVVNEVLGTHVARPTAASEADLLGCFYQQGSETQAVSVSFAAAGRGRCRSVAGNGPGLTSPAARGATSAVDPGNKRRRGLAAGRDEERPRPVHSALRDVPLAGLERLAVEMRRRRLGHTWKRREAPGAGLRLIAAVRDRAGWCDGRSPVRRRRWPVCQPLAPCTRGRRGTTSPST